MIEYNFKFIAVVHREQVEFSFKEVPVKQADIDNLIILVKNKCKGHKGLSEPIAVNSSLINGLYMVDFVMTIMARSQEEGAKKFDNVPLTCIPFGVSPSDLVEGDTEDFMNIYALDYYPGKRILLPMKDEMYKKY